MSVLRGLWAIFVGRLHSSSAADPGNVTRFATDELFDALRIDPFLRVTARSHPDLRERFAQLARTTTGTHLAVVHGDVSPKNILLGPHGPVLLDAECAWFGDPAFDVAFCLNHLLIKSIRLAQDAVALLGAARGLADEHARHVDWESLAGFGQRVASLLPALTLARVDGTSPVEYLTADQRRRVRAIGRALLRDPVWTAEELFDRWAAFGDDPAAEHSGATNAQGLRTRRDLTIAGSGAYDAGGRRYRMRPTRRG